MDMAKRTVCLCQTRTCWGHGCMRVYGVSEEFCFLFLIPRRSRHRRDSVETRLPKNWVKKNKYMSQIFTCKLLSLIWSPLQLLRTVRSVPIKAHWYFSKLIGDLYFPCPIHGRLLLRIVDRMWSIASFDCTHWPQVNKKKIIKNIAYF